MRQVLKGLQDRWAVIWAKHSTKRAFIVVGTLIGVSIYFQPIIAGLINAGENEKQSLYDKQNYYLARKKKLEEEKRALKYTQMKELHAAQTSQQSSQSQPENSS